MTDRHLTLAMTLTDGYGNLHGAWRAPHVDPNNYADIDADIQYAQAAERGLFTFLFTPDFPAVRGDVEHSTISNVLDPIVSLTAIARDGADRVRGDRLNHLPRAVQPGATVQGPRRHQPWPGRMERRHDK